MHKNDGRCAHCQLIIKKYPGIDYNLKTWFERLQVKYPEVHVSEAGRGKEQQEILLRKKATKARWTESSHNYNCALDLFELGGESKSDIYEKNWFMTVIAPNVPSYLEWYGWPEYKNKKDKFYELPHIEVKNWKNLRDLGLVSLVEEIEIKSA